MSEQKQVLQALEKVSDTLAFIVGYVDGLRTHLQANAGNKHFDVDVEPTTQQTLTGGQQQ